MSRGALVRVAVALAVCVTLLSFTARPATAGRQHPYRLLWDNFRHGFSADGPHARWFHFSAGPYVGDDGVVTTGRRGLRVVSSGTNQRTGEPAFVRTIGQEHENGGLPGSLDHVKWLVYMNHQSSAGFPGFDAVRGQELSCETWAGGRTFGTRFHPFGEAVIDPEDDLRLASVAQNLIDFETFMVFDFFMTNQRIYAFYERLPFGRSATDNYAAFSYMVPVAENRPGQLRHLRIAYDRARGTVRWLLDEREVFRVDRIGHRIDREFMTLDHGGDEEVVSPRQLDCGMGQFSLLDAHLPSGTGLVRLSDAPGFYFDPEVGPPAPERFVDDRSLLSNRLFGQGAELLVRRYVVSSLPTPRDGKGRAKPKHERWRRG